MLAAVLPKPGAGLGKQQAPQEILAEEINVGLSISSQKLRSSAQKNS